MSIGEKCEPDFYPGVWAADASLPVGAPEAKSPPLEALYPEKDRYLTIAPERYFDPGFMRREWNAIWTRSWTCAGRVSDLREVGSWFKYDLGHESFIVVRGADRQIRAFYNVCQHRGRRLVSQDFGRSASFVCGFHSWVYGLDGTNRRVTDREFFKEAALCGDLGLKPARCESWAGFVFVNMDPAAPPLLDYLAPMPDLLAMYRMENMHIVKDVTVAIDCNWKVACEAFLEPYHVHATHPALLPAVDDLQNQYDFYPNGHGRIVTPLAVPSPRERDRNSVNPALAYMLREAGVDPDAFTGNAANVRNAIRKAKRDADNPFGLDYSEFSDAQLTDDWNPSIFPNLAFNAFPEAVQVMRYLPHATHAGKCHFSVWILVPPTKAGIRPPANFGVEEDVDVSGAARPVRRYNDQLRPELGDVLAQDISNMAVVQQGLISRGMADGVRLSEQEQRVQQLHAEIDRRLALAEEGAGRP
ncbi:MAG TPA: aromatic ring-hydroxylating dioxygenase subunit alpha [Alphaproteobacteria bacterium]|nr:aromatic ring-hydroxylating dioxygenase subunit alpha [Alphaproteobacteria bacterium]